MRSGAHSTSGRKKEGKDGVGNTVYPSNNNTASKSVILIYISSVHVLVNKLLLNGSTDFDEIFCVYSGGFHNGLD